MTSLCRTCQHSLNYERANGGEVFYCAILAHGLRVPGDIVRCSDFEERNRSSKYDMEKIAWVLKVDKGGRVKGFTPPVKEG